MAFLPLSGVFLELGERLMIDVPQFQDLAKEWRPEIFQKGKRNAPWLWRSLNGSIAESRLLDEIRRIVTAAAATAQCPRLVISGTHEQTRSEEHTSELQSLMRISYAVFCLKKKKKKK